MDADLDKKLKIRTNDGTREGDEFVLQRDDSRGIVVVGWYEVDDTRLHYQTRQYIPDEFFKQTNELDAAWSKSDKRKSHYEQFASIPGQLAANWKLEIGDWTKDEDAMDKLKKRLNSSDWRKLRTGGGAL